MYKNLILSINTNSELISRVDNRLREIEGLSKTTKIHTSDCLDKLRKTSLNNSILVNFDNGLIIPEDILIKLKGNAFNFHSATPDFPGRDCHHFAIYENTKEFGSTLHFMEKLVDSGKIIDVNRFEVKDNDGPVTLHKKSLESCYKLFDRYIDYMLKEGSKLMPRVNLEWTGKYKGTRSLFNSMCEISTDISKDELNRRIKAFSNPKYKNIYTVIDRHRFYLDSSNIKTY